MDDKKEDESSEKSKFFSSAHSPFPYGSPLQKASQRSTASPLQRHAQTSFTGSPGQKLLLGTSLRGRTSSLNNSFGHTNGDVVSVTPRLKSQDLYGGPVMFGSSARRSRLLSSTPYSAAMSLRMKERNKSRSMSAGPATESTSAPGNTTWSFSILNNKGPSGGQKERTTSDPPVDGMSSTARLILETLDKMSTPIQDALKMPVPRAEKRKLVEDELNCSLGSPGRRRPRLGGGPDAGRSSLGGPPLRKNYSPLPPRPASAIVPKLPPPSAALERAPSPILPVPPPAPAPSILPPAPETEKIVPMISSTPLKPFGSATAPSATNTPLSSTGGGGGKLKSKVSEGVRDSRARKDVEDPAPEIPAFLTGKVPVLKVPASLPSFRLEASTTSSTTKDTNTGFFDSLSKKKPTETPSPVTPAAATATTPVFGLSKPIQPVPKAKDAEKHSEQFNNSSIMFSFKQPVAACQKPVAAESLPAADLKARRVEQSSTDNSEIKTSRKFKFNTPRVLSTKTLVGSVAGTCYSFCLPTTIWPGATVTTTAATTTVLPVAKDVQTTLLNFKSAAMPDVTNNIKRKGVDVIQETGKGSLPDITASTVFGFGPAKHLKQGSVMDILGKKP